MIKSHQFIFCIFCAFSAHLFGEKPFGDFESNVGEIKIVEITDDAPSLADAFKKEPPVADSNLTPPLVLSPVNTGLEEGIKLVPAVQVVDAKPSPSSDSPVSPRLAPVTNVATTPDIEIHSVPPSESLPVVSDELVLEKTLDRDEGVIESVTEDPSKTSTVESIDPDALPFLTSDFFAGSLTGAVVEEDPMGTQRLLQVKNSRFSPSLLAGTAFKHTSNPDKAENPERKNSTTLDLSIGVNLGLGEYAVGDYIVCAPAASLMQMRTYNDPLQKFGKDMRVYDADVFIAGLTAPLVLPNDYTVTLSHSYVAPSTFRGGRNLISYSNTPTITLTKNMPMDNGSMLILVAGMSYTFSNGDTLEEQIADSVYFNFLKAVMESGGSSPGADYPANLQDGLTFMLSASYMIPYSEKISLVPSISYQSFSFTEGLNDGRVDKTFNLGFSASYLFYEWLSLSFMANYTTKSSNNPNTPEFDDFIFGGGINVNHAF